MDLHIQALKSTVLLALCTCLSPILKKGEVILFDINLIHGTTENLGIKTRVSLEMRLFNRVAKKPSNFFVPL